MSDDEQRQIGRRADDKTLKQVLVQMKHLNDVNEGQTRKLDTISADITTMREILTAWNNLKGVGWFIKGAAKLIIGLSAVGAAVLILFSWLKGLRA